MKRRILLMIRPAFLMAVIVLFSTTSCEIGSVQGKKTSGKASVVFSVVEEKALTRLVPDYEPDRYTWFCASGDATESKSIVSLGPEGTSNPAGPFNTGMINLTLTASLDESGERTVYRGKSSVVLEEGLNLVELSVSPLMEAEGVISLPERGAIKLEDSSGSPIKEYTEIITLTNMGTGRTIQHEDSEEREFRVPSGRYVVAIAYVSPHDNGIEYGKERIMVPVYDWSSTKISGNLDENTGYVDFVVDSAWSETR